MAQNTPAPAAGQKPKKVKKSATSGMSRALVRRETTSAYLFLLPSLIFFVTFVVVPMFICVYYSFTDYGLGGVKGFAGLSNYIKLFQDPIFHRGFLNTVLMVVVAVPSVTAFSLWVSSAIYKMHSIPRSFFRCVFYLPVVTGSVAITVVWKWILDPYNGILNQVAGTSSFDWLGNPKTAIWFIILILFTTSIGQPIVLYVAALGNVDSSLEEAAKVDGANSFQSFLRITVPMLSPTTFLVVLLSTVNLLKEYALVQGITQGGPGLSTTYIIQYIFDKGFNQMEYGYASAISTVVMIVFALIAYAQFKVNNGGET